MPRGKSYGRRVKWAHLHEIDYRTRVGTQAWKRRNGPGARKLSAWRRLHALGGPVRPHSTVQALARQKGRSPSSTLTTSQMVRLVKKLERRPKIGGVHL